ncbi:MAG: proton-conducting transporter membrane subunit [Desulfurococcaceae archaeon]
MYANAPALLVFVPVLGAFLAPLVGAASRNRKILAAYHFFIHAIVLALSAYVVICSFSSDEPLVLGLGGWPPPIGVTYVVDRVGSVLCATTALVFTAIAAYSYDYLGDDGYTWYVALVLGCESGLLGVILTGDIFNLFVMIEVVAVSSYGLVMYYRDRAYAIVSGLKYAFMGAMGTTLFFLATAVIYNVFGTLNLADLALKLRGRGGSSITGPPPVNPALQLGVALALALWAFSIKSGVFPNHFWLPDAHPAAPSPVSAMLSGLVVNAGVVALYKVFYLTVGGSTIPSVVGLRQALASVIMVMGGASAILGSLLMNFQDDVKRLVAYSTIMNMGIMFMVAGVPGPLGPEALLYYVVAHSLAKSTLFMAVGLSIRAGGTRRLAELAGAGKAHPTLSLSLALSTLSLAGVPPLPGFLGKLLAYEALFEQSPAAALTMVLASAIGFVAYAKLFYILLIAPPARRRVELAGHRLALASTAMLALTSAALGALTTLWPSALEESFARAAAQVADVDRYLMALAKYLAG